MFPTESDDLFSAPNEGMDAPRENPEAVTPKQSGARTYGPNNRDMPEELQQAQLCLLQEAQRQDPYQRRIEIMRDRRNRFYERGIQHIYEGVNGAFVIGTPGALVPNPNSPGEELQCGQFIDDYNIFSRALQIIIAKLTENSPGIDFQPDTDNAADHQAAAAAEAYRLLYDRRNDSKELLTAIVRMMGLSGRVVTWTRTEADAQRWGVDEDGSPRKVQLTTVYGTMEGKVPILAKSMRDWPYCIISEDPHIFLAKMQYPEFADKIRDQGDSSTGDTQFERLARIGALQGNSAAYQVTDTYQWYVERKYAWFRPSMFQSKELEASYTDEEHAGQPWTLRDALMEAFPEGCMATFVGTQYVGSRNVSMDDELAVDFPYAGDGMSRMAIMDPAIVIQDDFNDDMNNYHEVKVTGWPSTWVNEDTEDIGAINDQTAAPYCFRAMKSRPPREMKMGDQFYREPNPEIPASFMQHTEYMATQLLQFILAIPSAVQGAGMPDQKTASGYQAALVQAMGQLGVIWGAVQRLMSKVYRQAALAAVRDDPEPKTIIIPGKNGPTTLDMANLSQGQFLAHPDTDSGYPETTVQKRGVLAQLMEWMTANPAIAQAVLSSPTNWDFMARTFGLSELVIPEARVRRKQQAEIELLLQQGPIGPSAEEAMAAAAQYQQAAAMAQATGQPPPLPQDPQSMLRSTIPVDPLDYHEWEFEECREKLSDWPWLQQQIAAGNGPGIENIRLHAKEHQQAAAAMAQRMAPAPVPVAKAGAPQEKPTEQQPPEAPGLPAQ